MTDPSSSPANRRTLDFIFLPVSLFPLIALVTYDWHAIAALNLPPNPSSNWIGALGDNFAYFGYNLVGLAIWIVPVITFSAALVHLSGRRVGTGIRKLWLIATLVALAALVQHLAASAPLIPALAKSLNIADPGGACGYLLTTKLLAPLLGNFGALVVILTLLVASVSAAIGLKNIIAFLRAFAAWTMTRHSSPGADDASATGLSGFDANQDAYLAAMKAKADAKHERELEKQRIREQREAERLARRMEKDALKAAKTSAPAPAPVATAGTERGETAASAADKGPYQLPPLSLLSARTAGKADHSDVDEMSRRLIDTLKLFNIDASLSYTVKGPVVTKYAILLAPGTLYTTVTRIADNLKGALHAKSLRIESPIPGKEEIGIEVPNRAPAGIGFREIIESDAWRNSSAELPLLFGKRADGEDLVSDLASMPHMLVAGATGQGKSVCLNSLICGLLMSRTPEQLKLIMVDPKSVEFTAYASIPHLLVPVINDNRKVVGSLHWAVAEMEKRLKLFQRAHVRNIYDYNHRHTYTQTELFGADTELGTNMPKTVPYIVIIIDEAADLIGQCGKEVNPDIQRITQKARAAGIHLILATQRPDAKIITGTIKANIPGRVAFKTSSSIDSRTILDETGAENLIGKGDMLFRGKDNVLVRAQGAWISDEDIFSITSFIEKHSNTQFDENFAKNLGRIKEATIDDPFASLIDEGPSAPAATDRALVKAAANADDVKKAIECIINFNRASVSFFQRQMSWGYNHAAKILDQLAERGIVSAAAGAGPRQILMTKEELTVMLSADADAGSETADAGDETAPSSYESDGDNLFDQPSMTSEEERDA